MATRAYQSTVRQQAAQTTRALIVDAAIALFNERGWSRTTVKLVAQEAGVALETVYSSVGNKTDLLKAALEVSVVGDYEAAPLADRPEFKAMGEGDFESRLAAVPAMLSAMYGRSVGIYRAINEAAQADPTIYALRQELHTLQRVDTARGVELAVQRKPTQTEIDGVWALISFETYDNLIYSAGWTDEQYKTWLVDILAKFLRGGPQ
ncbi:MAG: TetR/AcrR family transcriptional regulator [Nocardiaceae bacterium]|nr:TetR/AcrR family transcriptional regulator [Nocardiaceae bacterium]